MPVTAGFNHVATLTSDMDRTVQFYRDAIGAELTFEMDAKDDHPRMAILDLGGGAGLNVFEVDSGDIIGDRRKRGPVAHRPLRARRCIEDILEQIKDRLVSPAQRSVRSNDSATNGRVLPRPDGMELEVCAKADKA